MPGNPLAPCFPHSIPGTEHAPVPAEQESSLCLLDFAILKHLLTCTGAPSGVSTPACGFLDPRITSALSKCIHLSVQAGAVV